MHSDDEVHDWFENIVLRGEDTWVVDNDARVVALLVLDGGWVDQLYVDPDVTGHGLGTKLLDFAKSQGRDTLELWTFQSNAGARRFYERHGFLAITETEGDNEEGAPDVLYRWSNR